MDSSPGMWAFVVANLGVLLGGGLLTTLSYLAYRRRGQRSYGFATVGFGLIMLGGIVDPMFLIMMSVDFSLDLYDVLLFTIAEDSLIAFGLGFVFYAITQHDPGEASTRDEHLASTGEEGYWDRSGGD